MSQSHSFVLDVVASSRIGSVLSAYRADPNKNQKALSEKSLSYLKSAKSSQIPEKREEKSHQDLRRKKLSSNVGQGSNPGSLKS